MSDLILDALLIAVVSVFWGVVNSFYYRLPMENWQCTQQKPIEGTMPVVNECVTYEKKIK